MDEKSYLIAQIAGPFAAIGIYCMNCGSRYCRLRSDTGLLWARFRNFWKLVSVIEGIITIIGKDSGDYCGILKLF